MTKREVVRKALRGEKPPYVPWQMGFTLEAADKLRAHYGTEDLAPVLQNHCFGLGSGVGYFEPAGENCVRDIFGVVWDRSADKDIGVIRNQALPEPTLKGYSFPDPRSPKVFRDMAQTVKKADGRFVTFSIGFSLYERAWTLRGMETLMMDFYDHPDFVHQLLDAIADYNIEQVREALKHDIDAVHFGDDWGQQHGLQMGPALWREFIYPRLKRMYAVVKDAGKFLTIHSCGDVDELFDDLIGIGLDCFNPFQPEVMDVDALFAKYRGRLSFHGGLSTQKTLPYGKPEDVIRATKHLLELGRDGNYLFAPAHSVEGDVPVENMVAFIETVQNQAGYKK
jgi:uroporphyrinogen decarboxylase